MNQKFIPIFIILLFTFLPFQNLIAQDNLKVEFESPTSVPDFLNICGDPDTATVTVSLNGLSLDARQNILATLDLFKGVELAEFIAAESSVGVTLNNNANLNSPIFGLPDLDPSGTTFINITFTIAAKCEYIDTLTLNNAIQVQNTWNFDYTMGGNPFAESEINTEYRDAFAVPQFTGVVNNSNEPARSGDCFSRDIVVTNSGLDGFVDQVIYSNTQGAGIYVESIEVNGIDLPVTKTMLVTGDTLIEAMIDGSFFLGNTVGGGSGDNDGFFDPNEAVTITENICVVNCLASRASQYKISWGCDSRFCNTITTSDFINIGQGNANVQVEDSGTVPNVFSGYCQTGVSTVTFTNNGAEVDPGFGAMLNLEVGIGMGNGFGIADGGFFITQLTIAGVTVPLSGTMNLIDNNPLFLTDPDGSGVGLEDLDSDGFFDDLGIGEAFEITAVYDVDCSNAQLPGSDGDCANDLGTSFSARVDYDNACMERIVRLRGNYFRPNNRLSNAKTNSEPDAFVEQDTFFIRQTVNRSTSRFEKNCSGGEQYQVNVKMPVGVTPVISTIRLIRNGGTVPIPLLSNVMSNDTLFLVFDASFTPFITGEYEVVLGFEADCSAELGFVNFPYEFAYYCPPCDCRHLWHCDTLQGPKLHAEMPPCPPLTFVCPVGVATKSFDVSRTTFGYTDATYATPFDQNLANKKVAISCDSIEMRVVNVIGDEVINDSIGIVISYANADKTSDSTATFLFDTGVVRFTNFGNEYFCNIDASVLEVTMVDSTQVMTFDLNSCLTGLSLNLQPNDTFEFVGKFSLNPDGPYPIKFTTVPELRAAGYGAVDDINEACDNFGDIFTIAKNQTVVNFPSSSAFPEGCEEKYLSYNLITINNGFTEWFGVEYRQAVGIDSIVINYDPMILESFGIFEAQISIPGHPIYGNNYFLVQGFEATDNGRYVGRFDTLQFVPALNNVLNYSFSFRIRVIPNCQSEMGSSNENNQYNFDPEIFYRDRFYATDIGDGSCSEQKVESAANNIYYTDSPDLTLIAASNPNFNLVGDTASWDLQLCNASFVGRAGLTWFSLEDPTGSIEVVSMEDITNPAAITNLLVTQYGSSGSNYFVYTNPLEIGDAVSTFDDICNVVRVKALVNQCGTTNFNARVGWNCIGYSEPSWNPELYPPCKDVTLDLVVTTLDPSLDANIVEQPTGNSGICDTSTIAILIRNTNLGSAYDIRSQIILPMQGTTLIPGSIEIAYPSGAAYEPVAIDPVYTTTTSRGDIYEYANFSNLHTYLDQNGLSGFDPLNPTDSNEYKIRYQFVTDCDFMSGSISYYAFQGLKNCGDSTNYETGETLPIKINGTAVGLDKIFEIYFSNSSALIPNASAPLEITAVNLTTTVTDSSDLVSLLLPESVTYDPNTTAAIEPGGWILGEPEIKIDGNFQILFWNLPIGLLQGDSAVFTFNVITPEEDCAINNLQAGLNTIQRKELICAVSGVICDVDAITSINHGALIDLPVTQNTLSFIFSSVTSLCSGVDEETIQFEGAVSNHGTAFPAVSFDVEYYFDQDESGNVNVGDQLVATITETGPIAANAVLPISHTIPVSDNQVCNIIVRIDSTGLGICEIAEVLLGEPQLLNAGNDQVFCEITATTITANLGDPTCGSLSNYTYHWLAISPASTTNLSATDIPNPVLTVNHNATVQDTLQYILETTRPSCGGINRDTISLIRALGITVDGGSIVFVQSGGSTTLSPTVNGGFALDTYAWSPASTLNDSTSSNPIASPLADTDYSVTVTSASGCSAEAIAQVQIGGAVTISVELYDTIICAETIIQFAASGGTDYVWVEDAGNFSTGNLSAYNIPNPIFSNGLPASTYNYQVIVEDNVFPGFYDTANVVIQILPSLDVQITSSLTTFICDGDEVALTGTGADIYAWENLTTNTLIGNGAVITVMPTVETIYQVTGTDTTSGCFATEQIIISINEGVDAEVLVNPAVACEGETILLVGGNGISYEWLEDGASLGTGDSIMVTPIAGSIYSLVVENIVGCQDTVGVMMEVIVCPCDDLEVSSIITIEATCGNATGEATINLVDDPNNYTFTWSPDLGVKIGIGNVKMELPFGGYEVTIQNNNSPACSAIIYLIIQNVDGPTASATTTPATCFAPNGSATLAPDTLNFLWKNGSTNATRNDLTAGVHFVTITDPAKPNCSNVIEVVIDEQNSLAATLTVTQAPDCGMANGSATINLTGGSGNYAYSWAGGTNTRNNLSAGFYSVIIIDLDSTMCELVYDFVLTDNVPAANILITEVIGTSCVGVANGLVVFTVDFDSLFNAPADTIITNGFQNFENGNLSAGDYCLIVSDSSGCVGGENCFSIASIETLEVNFIVTPDCDLGGTITLETLGGTAPYEFDWADLPDSLDTPNRIELEIGLYGMSITDSLGCEVSYSILILPCDVITSDTFCNTIFIGQTDTLLLDVSQLPGSVVSLQNFCPDEGGIEVDFFEDFGILGIEYAGLGLGQDSACIEFCDDLGFCDTTYMCISVIEFGGLPMLVDDKNSVDIGLPVVLNVKENDVIFGGIDTMYISEQPFYGTAMLNLDGSVTYNAGDTYCERLDSFSYVICNSNGCDTANVCIFINCIDIVIFNAVSPNGDQVNDAFYVAGIADYPNNMLKIYNRWGNMVYEKVGYKNEWSGTFNGKRDIPDGTYFYILELRDPNDTRVFQGYLEISR
jgi:gliding motility-associated-like protein